MKTKPRLSEETALAVFLRYDNFPRCVCGHHADDWHHILPQSKWRDLADNPDNIVPVCKGCHEAHTNASRRLPRSVCAPVEALELSGAQLSYIERTYRHDWSPVLVQQTEDDA